MKTYIYDLSDPRTGYVRYVGKSVNPKERLATHIREARNGSVVHSRRWIDGLLQHGLRPILGILEETNVDNANECERYWIAVMNFLGADLTNRTPGGDGQSPGYRPKPESVARGAAKLRGRKASPEQKRRLKEALSRPEMRQRRSEIMRARMANPALRAIAQHGRTGQPMSEESKQKIAASWTPERKKAHAAEKSALPFDDRWRDQLQAALAARWAKYREAKRAG